MALIACPECGRQVSSAAASCPHCGHPLRLRADANTGLLAKLATVVGAWLVVPWIARLLVFLAACVVAIVALVARD